MENNTIESTGKRVVNDAGALKETANQAAKGLSDHANQVARDLGEHATKAKGQVGQLGQDVADHAAAHVENAKAKAMDTYGYFREYGSDHPVTVLAVGFVAGFLFAMYRRS